MRLVNKIRRQLDGLSPYHEAASLVVVAGGAGLVWSHVFELPLWAGFLCGLSPAVLVVVLTILFR